MSKGINGTALWKDSAQKAAYLRAYQKKHRARLNKQKATYKRTHRPMANAIQMKRRAGGGSCSAEHWAAILGIAPYCFACGGTERLQPDHVVALAHKGANEPENIQPLCRTCNASKGKRQVDYRAPLFLKRVKEVSAKDLRTRVKR